MEPVHQGYYVEHGQAGHTADVARIGREVGALENQRTDAGVGANGSLGGLEHLAPQRGKRNGGITLADRALELRLGRHAMNGRRGIGACGLEVPRGEGLG